MTKVSASSFLTALHITFLACPTPTTLSILICKLNPNPISKNEKYIYIEREKKKKGKLGTLVAFKSLQTASALSMTELAKCILYFSIASTTSEEKLYTVKYHAYCNHQVSKNPDFKRRYI